MHVCAGWNIQLQDQAAEKRFMSVIVKMAFPTGMTRKISRQGTSNIWRLYLFQAILNGISAYIYMIISQVRVVVCPLELQGINNMWICPILSPYFSGLWSWKEYQCHNDHALVVCDQANGQFNFLVSIL